MIALLLCGYRAKDESEDALFADQIEKRITELKALNLKVVCVVAGEYADDQLRSCRRMIHCELVFDTNEQPNLATNLRAGLAGTDGAGCFVLPAEIPAPPTHTWESMREQWRIKGFLTETHIYQAVDAAGAPSHLGFPLLVTRSGNTEIKEMGAFRSLTDDRLKYCRLQVSEGLASTELPL